MSWSPFRGRRVECDQLSGVSPERSESSERGCGASAGASADRLVRRRAFGIHDLDEIVIGCVANYLPVKLMTCSSRRSRRFGPPTGVATRLVGDGPPALLERQIASLV